MINLVIVDDHEIIRYGVKKLLNTVGDIKIVGEASSGEEALLIIRSKSPDIVLMDLKMPGMGGLEATHKLFRVKTVTPPKVIVLTSCDQAPFPDRLIRAGVSGYILKSASVDAIVLAIRKVHAGQIYITPEIAQQMALRQVSDASKTPFAALSERELQVMWMITHGNRIGEIAHKLNLSSKTINTYRYRLYEKLFVRNDVELTHLALHYGMLDKDPIRH